MVRNEKNWLKFTFGFIICLFIRLLPFRPPNIEPILAMQMPFSKKYGALGGFAFAFVSMILYDVLTNRVGLWTLITASVYGFLALFATYFFQNKEMTGLNFAKFAVFGTLFFDALTGLSIGPIFFGQSLSSALIGQIPFTLMHLLGNVTFAFVLSPLIYKYIIENKKPEFSIINNVFVLKSN
jgi:uncharacterized membrane protein